MKRASVFWGEARRFFREQCDFCLKLAAVPRQQGTSESDVSVNPSGPCLGTEARPQCPAHFCQEGHSAQNPSDGTDPSGSGWGGGTVAISKAADVRPGRGGRQLTLLPISH